MSKKVEWRVKNIIMMMEDGRWKMMERWNRLKIYYDFKFWFDEIQSIMNKQMERHDLVSSGMWCKQKIWLDNSCQPCNSLTYFTLRSSSIYWWYNACIHTSWENIIRSQLWYGVLGIRNCSGVMSGFLAIFAAPYSHTLKGFLNCICIYSHDMSKSALAPPLE